MENNMLATISLVHVFLGFASGMALASMINLSDKYKLYKALEKAKDEKFKQDLRIDELLDRIGYFEERTAELEEHVCKALHTLKSSFTSLPPPDERPLKRSRAYLESDSEEEELDLPISPDVE